MFFYTLLSDLKDVWSKFILLSGGIFSSIFYYCYSVVKTWSSIEFENSTFHLCRFNNSCFTAIVEVLFLIHYPLGKYLKEGHVFSAFYFGSAFFSNLAGFKLQNFSSISWATMVALLVSLTKINITIKLNLLSNNGGKLPSRHLLP